MVVSTRSSAVCGTCVDVAKCDWIDGEEYMMKRVSYYFNNNNNNIGFFLLIPRFEKINLPFTKIFFLIRFLS